MTWMANVRKYYENLGYVYTKYGDTFFVNVKDLNINSRKKVTIICDECGCEYQTSYGSYNMIINKKGRTLCRNCVNNISHKKKSIRDRQKTLERINKICEDNNYVLLTNPDEIKFLRGTYIRIKCPIHGEVKVYLLNFLNRKRCPKCGIQKRDKSLRNNIDDVERIINSINGNILLNKNEYKNAHELNLKIKCGICGKIFVTSLHNYKKGYIKCKECSFRISNGELFIKKYLEDNNIYYKQEHWFKDCRNIKPLRFDFYLPDYNIAIEFDGRQHYDEYPYRYYGIKESKEKLENLKSRDNTKNDYCKKNNIKLIRIPYWKIDNINSILKKEINTYVKDIV